MEEIASDQTLAARTITNCGTEAFLLSRWYSRLWNTGRVGTTGTVMVVRVGTLHVVQSRVVVPLFTSYRVRPFCDVRWEVAYTYLPEKHDETSCSRRGMNSVSNGGETGSMWKEVGSWECKQEAVG